MLVTDQFVFVHVPKTGGTFIQTVLGKHLPVVDLESVMNDRTWSHASYGALPAEWRERPAFCVVRNPWDWYVSWFHYQTARGPRRRARPVGQDPWGKLAVWQGALRSGEADFKEAVSRACTGDFEHPLAPVMRREGIDLYSAQFRAIVGPAVDRTNFTVLKFERGLRKQLVQHLSTYMEVPRSLVAEIRGSPPLRASEHGPYADYYDDELRRLVGQQSRWLCERFDYTFTRRSPVARAGGR